MKRDPNALRDLAAEPALRRLRADRKRVCQILKPALKVLERRLFDEDLNVTRLWRESGLTKDRTSLFTAELAETPGDYIAGLRLEVGRELLAATDLKVSRIGPALGYTGGADTFSKAFKRRHKLSPSAFRQAARNGEDDGEDPALEARESLSSLVAQVGRAISAGDLESALAGLHRAEGICSEDEMRALTENLAIARHERGAERTRAGDVDRAYDDLALARHCYAEAAELSPSVRRRRRHLGVSCDTDAALLSALCPDCRERLVRDEGRTLRHCLRLALELIPRDLEWFGVCCDDCYRVVWGAVSRARAGLMDDAWKAWWLSENADLEDRQTPPSRGRIIAALTEVERLVSGDQLARKGYCDLAVEDAGALDEPLLEVQACIWRASVLRALGDVTEAGEELLRAAESSRSNPWLAALHDRMAGVLQSNTNRWRKGEELLRSANDRYKDLDPHIGGWVLTQHAIACCFLGEHEHSVASSQKALSFLDGRRDPFPGNGIVPVNLAGYYALLGDWESAESSLSSCRFDRGTHPGLAATEILQRACLELLQGRSREAVRLFDEGRERFAKLHRPLDAALAASYSVEALARAGDRATAIENAGAALSFFQAAGCAQDVLEAAAKLRALLEASEIDVLAVTASARSLARRHGGWLPEI